MGLFDDYYDPDQFEASGGLPGRLMSLMRQQGMLPDGDVSAPPSSATPAQMGASLTWPSAGTTSFAPYLLASSGPPQPQAQQAPTQLAQVPIQSPQTQPQVQQPQPGPQGQRQQPATDANQPVLNGPATGNGPGGSSGGAGGGNAGTDPNNPTSDQSEAEPAPFSGFANPTRTESLVNQAKMNDQKKLIEADPSGEHGFVYEEKANAQQPSAFVTTGKAIAHYRTPDQAGQVFTEINPFYVKQGSRHAIIDASPSRPVTVTIGQDGKFTISQP
jgi:hypothetical protein